MSATVRSVVPCEAVSWDGFFTLKKVRYAWPEPPMLVSLWNEILNPAERELTLEVQLFRRDALVRESAEELILGTDRRYEVDVELVVGDLERKSYTVRVVLNGVEAQLISLDFGAGGLS